MYVQISGHLWSTLCNTSTGIIHSSSWNLLSTSYSIFISGIFGVFTAITEMEFGFSMILPFVFNIGSPVVEWQLCAITLSFIMMKCLPSVLYPIPILLVLCMATPSMNSLLKFLTAMTQSLNTFLPPALDTYLLHVINFGFWWIWL